MSISIDSFRAMAGTGMESRTVELSQDQPGQLKSSGFWGRLFGRAGADAARNQQVMDELCLSIRDAMGKNLEAAARTALGAVREAGKPLTGMVIRDVLSAVEAEKAHIATYNRSTAAIYISHPGHGLPALLANRLPQGTVLGNDVMSEIADLVHKQAEEATANTQPLESGTLDWQVQNLLGKAIDRATPAFMQTITALSANGRQPGLTAEQVRTIRPIIVTSGVMAGPELDAALDLVAVLEQALPRMREVAEGMDLLTVLQDIHRAMTEIRTARGLGQDADLGRIYSCAVQSALTLSDISRDEATGLAASLFTGTAAEEVLGGLNRCISLGQTKLPAALKATFGDLVGGFTWRTPLSAEVARAIPFTKSETIPDSKVQQYLYAERLLPDKEVYARLAHQGFGPSLTFCSLPGERLIRLMDTTSVSGNLAHRQIGCQLLVMYYDELDQQQPDGQPFRPDVVWNTIFKQKVPEGVTRDNLAERMGQTMEEVIDALFMEKNTDPMGRSANLLPVLIIGQIYGLDPRTALEIHFRQGDKAITAQDLKSLSATPAPPGPPDEEIDKGIRKMAADLPRRGQCTVTIGGTAIALRDNPDMIDEADIANYQSGKPENSIVRTIRRLVNEMCGDGPATATQRASAFSMLSQASTGFMLYLSPIIGLRLSEHSPCDMRLERLDDGTLRLNLQTPEGTIGSASAVYIIEANGATRMTDIRLAAPGNLGGE